MRNDLESKRVQQQRRLFGSVATMIVAANAALIFCLLAKTTLQESLAIVLSIAVLALGATFTCIEMARLAKESVEPTPKGESRKPRA